MRPARFTLAAHALRPAGLSSTDPYAPLPRVAEGALIGVIGNDYDSPIIELGAAREFTADRDGRLYLTANRSSYTDARGAFNVRIRKELDLATMARTSDETSRNDSYDPFSLPAKLITTQLPRVLARVVQIEMIAATECWNASLPFRQLNRAAPIQASTCVQEIK